MARMSGNDECPSGNFGDSSQLTNWILDSGATCYMTPRVSDFITGSLEDTDKHIEVAEGHHVTVKWKGQVQIKMCDNHGDPFIATLHNVLLALNLCDRLFSTIALINSGHTCLFNKRFCSVYFGAKEKNAVTLPQNSHRKHVSLVKIKEMSKTKKLPSRNKIALELLHHILSHRSTRSLLAGDTDNVW